MIELSELKEAWNRDEVQSISRRYFISNGFDGTLTSIGITVGSFLSGVPSGLTVFQIGLGATIGLATSGIWSVWEIERAEKLAEVQDLEKSMLRDLDGTKVYERKMEGRVINALMSGLGPTLAMLLIIAPFLLETVFLTMLQATLISVAVAVALLFSFGAYMGSMSKQRWYVAGIRMGLAGLVVAALNVVLPG
ncbi:MAG: VIT1/CCC1 transporter family protein [Candidatus Nanohaloarchaea archaeon]